MGSITNPQFKGKPGRRLPTLKAVDILRTVSDATGVSMRELTAYRGCKQVYEARRKAFAALRDCGASYPEIGRLMQRDHSTIHKVLNR